MARRRARRRGRRRHRDRRGGGDRLTGRRFPPAAVALAAALVLGSCAERTGPGASSGVVVARAAGEDGVVRSERAAFRVATFAAGLERPWGAAFLPDGSLLVTERPGRLRVVSRDGAVGPPLAGAPDVVAEGQGGLLDVALAPDFAMTREVYLCHAARAEGGALTRLTRARLSADGSALEGARAILDAAPAQARGRNHFGCRIAFGPGDGKLYLATGDRFADPSRAQRGDDLAGKVLRLERDGRPAEGNPWAGVPGVRPEVWSLGHRNPQGLAFQPGTGLLWAAEFGPLGGDEVNVIRRGGNYGWPVVGRGVDYTLARLHETPSRPGMVDPVRWWVPVISPSGVAFYDGGRFPGWRGGLFLAGLNPPGLTRLSVEGEAVVGEERLLSGPGVPRLRHVLAGPDGLLYLLTDEARGGRVLRVEPVGGGGG